MSESEAGEVSDVDGSIVRVSDEPLRVPDDLSHLPGLTITADPGALACRLFLSGRLDEETVPLFAACLDGWAGRGMRHLVVDLSHATVVDESGAQVLAHAAHVLARGGGSLALLAPHRLIDGPLADCGLDLIESGSTAGDGPVIGVRRAQ
jgi:anti-anti-sigma factor